MHAHRACAGVPTRLTNMPTDARRLSLPAAISPQGTETESGITARISHVSFIHSSIKPLSGYWEFICKGTSKSLSEL